MIVVEVVPRLAGGGDARSPGGDELVLRFGDPEAGAATAGAGVVAGHSSLADPNALDGLVEGLDYHVVRAGESLSSIAELRFGDASLAPDLAAFNGLPDPDQVAEGDVLMLR